MGILRATKSKTLLKLSTAIFALSAVFIGGVLSLGHASAITASPPKLPITWTDSTHASATDQNKNVYLKAGYSCERSSNGVNTLVPLPPQPTWIGCSTTIDNSSDVFIWETSGSPKYALVISPWQADGTGKFADPGTCTPDTSVDSTCRANIWTINGKTLTGSSSSPNTPLLPNIVIGGAALITPTQKPVSNSSTTPSCETSGFTLAWIACPIIDGMAKAVDGIYGAFLQPLLVTKPISLDTTCAGQANVTPATCNPNFRTWSNFRVYGDVFLVIALLVVVFGQSIGGGFIDAYAAKKILPRLLLAAILINLSFYIVALAVDITNIVGQGIQTLLTQPFVDAKAFSISMNAGSQVFTTVAGAATGIGLAAGIGGLFTGGALAMGALIEFLPLLLMFVLLPALLVFLSVLFTLILRQGLIIVLLVISPVAFALYCLPNTEKYFKKWWELLITTLMVYPVIAVLFSLANILSVILERTSQASAVLNTLAQLMSFIGLVVPLFLIPFAFKISGGLLGRFQDITHGLGKRGLEFYKGAANDPNSNQSRARFRAGDRGTALREKAVSAGKVDGASRSKKLFGRAMNYGNLQATRSRYNRIASERVQTQIGTGDDSNVRDNFIAWDADYDTGKNDINGDRIKGGWFRRMDMEGGHAVPGSSAVYGDYDIGMNAKNKAKTLMGGSKSLLQDALYHEWKKTSFDPDKIERIKNQYGEILDDHNLSEKEGIEIMSGVGYRHAGQSLASKYSKFKKGSDGKWDFATDYYGLANEASLNIDTYSASRQDVQTYKAFTQGYTNASKQLGDNGDYSNDNTVIEDNTYGLKGKTRAEVYKMKRNLAEIASKHNPQQQYSGGTRQVVSVSEDNNQPQMSGAGGIANAPVQVQAAATQFYDTVFGPRPSTVPSNPTPPSSQPTTPGPRIIQPGDDDFIIPPDSRPGGANFR